MNNKDTESILVSNGKVRVYILHDTRLVAETTPILIIPGWGESAEAALNLANELVKIGHKVFIVDYENLDNSVVDSNCIVNLGFPKTERARTCAILELLSLENMKVDIIAHSQGAVAAMLSLDANPMQIGTIVLIAPAGIIPSSLRKLALNFIRSFFIQLSSVLKTENPNGKRYFSEVGRYISVNPIQMWRDAKGLAKVDIIPLLKNAKLSSRKLFIICEANDRVFPFKNIKNRIGTMFAIHRLNGGHDELFFNPKIFANYIDVLLKK